ncbi:Molybdopterin binding protein [Backusella circina FSU 941]|nr:Molybdopterin binding protein [Backusella circina FSU 941]
MRALRLSMCNVTSTFRSSSVFFVNNKSSTFTASYCLIGDEILNGKTRDSNAYYLSKYLFDLGIDLKKVEIVPDDYSAIAESVKKLSTEHDIVFTSGGIGPTHDDITYSALAKAYNLSLKLDQETCEKMLKMSRTKFPDWTLTEARKRMALFPEPCGILRKNEAYWVPVVVVNKNIHVLPGIPRLFEGLLDSLKPHLKQLVQEKGSSGHYHRVQVATKLPEGEIADFLSQLQDQVNQHDIKIGSYPNWGQDENDTRVVVSVVGKDQSLVQSIGQEVVNATQGWIDNTIKD